MENCWFSRFKQMVTNHLLVECSGDSDDPDFDRSDSDRRDQEDPLAFDDAVNGDDDAESCCCDAYDYCSNEGESSDHSINGEKAEKDDDDEEEEEEEEEKIPRRWEDSENLKSCVSVDSADSENEKNRQFWETCLAS